MEFVQDFMPVLVICKSEEDLIKTEGAIVSSTFFSDSQGQVHCNSEVNVTGFRICQEILWLSWLPACLMMIRSKIRALLCPQHCLYYKSMGNIFNAEEQVTPKQIA